ncbi:MAG: class I SAM-dependent methyltransferase [Thermodesulfovibrionales bacterium]|nr:class I SAM-dependent methyltransferase [Thermodesulfovibrionales bacterium]
MGPKTHETACIFCREKNVSFYFIKQNKYGEYPVLRCDACGAAFVWPRPEQGALEEFYRDLNYSNLSYEEVLSSDSNYYPDSVMDANRIISVCKRFSQGRNFLDVGAGFGRFSKSAHENGFKVSACEPNPNAVKVFTQLNVFEPDSCLFDKQYADKYEAAFDVVLLSQVLEHVADPEEMVLNIYNVIKGEGIAAIAVPHFGSLLSRVQGKKDMFISPPEHLNFFSKRGLVILFERCGFKLEYLHTVTKMNKKRFEHHIPFVFLSTVVWASIYGILKTSELFDMGIVINAYFRKIS